MDGCMDGCLHVYVYLDVLARMCVCVCVCVCVRVCTQVQGHSTLLNCDGLTVLVVDGKAMLTMSMLLYHCTALGSMFHSQTQSGAMLPVRLCGCPPSVIGCMHAYV